jgi:hypothetical protein
MLERMLAVVITLTPGDGKEFIDCQKASVRIAVVRIMYVPTQWNSTRELLEHACRLQESTREWLQNRKYIEYRPLFTTQDEWNIGKYVMEVLKPFQYWILWISLRYTVTLHHVITVYNNIFNQMHGVMRALAKNNTQWKEDLFCAVKLAPLKLSKYYAEWTATTGMVLVAAHILNLFHKLQSCSEWGKGMNMYPEDEASYTTQYEAAFLKYLEDEYCSKN